MNFQITEYCHHILEEYIEEGDICIDATAGNGGDHKIATRAATSLTAIESALNLLKKGGIINLCIYSGGDTGYEEKEAILNYLKTLDSKKWLVIVNSYFNRKNDPPLPVFIYRLK